MEKGKLHAPSLPIGDLIHFEKLEFLSKCHGADGRIRLPLEETWYKFGNS